MTERTDGTLLGGRVRYAQPRTGWRTGIEPVLLAAAVPARPGDKVLEAGCGAGAGLLCLLRRVPGVQAAGIELDPATAALARENLAANGFAGRVVTGDVAEAARLGPFDHAFANPPWHDPAGTQPPDSARALATHGASLEAWVAALAEAVGDGTVTLALPTARAGVAVAMLGEAGFGRGVSVPLWPKAGRAAKIVLVQAWRGAGGVRETAGVVLHEADGRFSRAAEAVLREGEALLAG